MIEILLSRCKRPVAVSLLATLTFLLLQPAIAQSEKPAGVGQHIGTWKLVSTKYGDAKDFTQYSEDSTRMKLINPTHFTWLEIDNNSKKVLTSAGGTYTLEGETYTESLDFAGEGMAPYLGKAQKFTIRVEGDKLFQSGQLSDGLKIEENWVRVK